MWEEQFLQWIRLTQQEQKQEQEQSLPKAVTRTELSALAARKNKVSGDTLIANLEFSVRTTNCLAMENIKTLDELSSWTESDLLRIRNMGRKCVIEIKEVLQNLGYNLKNE